MAVVAVLLHNVALHWLRDARVFRRWMKGSSGLTLFDKKEELADVFR